MSNIKQQIDNFRKTTPKHIQWLLLCAAFIVVIILLTLLLSGKKTDKDVVINTKQQIDLSLEPKQGIIFDTVIVGDSQTKPLKITVQTGDKMLVNNILIPEKQKNNIKISNNDCDVDPSDYCQISVSYKPTTFQTEEKVNLTIQYTINNIQNEIQYPVTISSMEPEPSDPIEEIKEEPIVTEEPTVIEEPEQTEPVEEIQEIAPAEEIFEKQVEPEIKIPSEKCSDFAIPAYNQSGVQIGWIKPSHGANYYHPFSDKDCSKPTGKYDQNTGIVTSLEDGSKIGTDADHIGYRNVSKRNITVPKLSNSPDAKKQSNNGKFDGGIWKPTDSEGNQLVISPNIQTRHSDKDDWKKIDDSEIAKYTGSAVDVESVTSSIPYDRTFILRQFKPIPATIVSEVRADPSVYGCSGTGKCEGGNSIPVRATVDRNVYSDDGRTIIIPTGTLLMGYLEGELPGPYQTIGRMNIKWYQFIRPDGIEFNFGENQDPYSADAQGRVGVPGYGNSDYIEQMVMPMLTAIVPAAVNMIAPIADTFVNQIDLDNNTVVQSGTVRSSEMAKQELITAWNKVAQKLVVDAIDNTIPPFSIAAGTRINVYSPVDLIVSCQGSGNSKCSVIKPGSNKRRKWSDLKGNVTVDYADSSWVGQVRSFNLQQYCKNSNGKMTIDNTSDWNNSGYDYKTVLMYCESLNYEAKSNAQQNAVYQNQKETAESKYGTQTLKETTDDLGNKAWKVDSSGLNKEYNTEVLGLTYNDDGTIANPFQKANEEETQAEEAIGCLDGSTPDSNGCCTGEVYTDLGEQGFNCCPSSGGDCFPPIQ